LNLSGGHDYQHMQDYRTRNIFVAEADNFPVEIF
jgi:hypothetical protein